MRQTIKPYECIHSHLLQTRHRWGQGLLHNNLPRRLLGVGSGGGEELQVRMLLVGGIGKKKEAKLEVEEKQF